MPNSFADTVRTARNNSVTIKKFSDNNLSTTTNGAVNYTTSGNKCLDFFFNISTYRKSNPCPAFDAAFKEDPEMAVRIMLYARDIRGGARERNMFRQLLSHINTKIDSDLAIMICTKVPEIGRWDDLLVVANQKNKTVTEFVYAMFAQALLAGNGLAAKWCPREKSVREADRVFATGLRKYMNLSARSYRKMLVGLTNVVETSICNKTYAAIDYNKLPSLAANRYSKLFEKYDSKRYAKYLKDLEKGVNGAKINAATLFPYDVLRQSNAKLKNAQWAALPNLVGDKKILAMIDTSGSMRSGCSEGLTCADVANSLGMYFASKVQGAFNGVFMTFSNSPFLVRFNNTKSVNGMLATIRANSIVANTNIEAAFNHILTHATKHKVPQNEMPEMLMIFSDMQFDQGVSNSYSTRTTYQVMQKKFQQAGYDIPNVVFWNIAARAGGNPVTMHQSGTALVSGFSPDIATSIMSAKTLTPVSIMLEAVMKPRYDIRVD